MTLNRTSIRSGAMAIALLAGGCQSHRAPHVADLTPPPGPPPVAKDMSPVQAPGPWDVFFDFDRAELKPETSRILDLVVDAYRKSGRSLVTITGHGDTPGSPVYNVDLGQRRADVVKAYLVDHGVSGRLLVTDTAGENDLLIPTPDDVRELPNRRVEIKFGPA